MVAIDKVTMKSSVNIFEQNYSRVISFEPFDDDLGLPFPLNLGSVSLITLLSLYIVNLVQGTRLRRTIFYYLRSPGTNTIKQIIAKF